MSFTTVTVEGTVTRPDGSPAPDGSVTLTLSAPIGDGSRVVAPRPLTAECAEDGSFSLTVVAGDDETTLPKGTYYEVLVAVGVQSIAEPFAVAISAADAPSVELFSLARLTAPEPPGNPWVSQILAGVGVEVSPGSGTGAVTVSATASAVASVNGRSGVVVLGPADVGADASGAAAAEATRALAAEALLAPKASPALTGNPTVPTQAPSTNSTRAASTAYADAAVGVEATARATADALLVPLSQKGANSGVGSLDSSGRQPIGQSPVSVVSASPTGGFIPWVTGLVIPLNQLVSNAGSKYICKTAHVAGVSFDAAKFDAIGGGGGNASVLAAYPIWVSVPGVPMLAGQTLQIIAAAGQDSALTPGAILMIEGALTVSNAANWLSVYKFASTQPINNDGHGGAPDGYSAFDFDTGNDPAPIGTGVTWSAATPSVVHIAADGRYDVSAKLIVQSVGTEPTILGHAEILWNSDNTGPFYSYDLFNLPVPGNLPVP